MCHIVSTSSILTDMGYPTEAKSFEHLLNQLYSLMNTDKMALLQHETYIPTILYLPSPSSNGTFEPDDDPPGADLSCALAMALSKSSCDTTSADEQKTACEKDITVIGK